MCDVCKRNKENKNDFVKKNKIKILNRVQVMISIKVAKSQHGNVYFD